MNKNSKDEHRYDDIINLPHHVSTTRPRMSVIDRAAQFSPFAALTGHEEAIKETARLTENKIVLNEDEIAILQEKLRFIQEQLPDCPEIQITYFKPDANKEGGSYLNKLGRVKKINAFERMVVMEDNVRIAIEDIVSIDGDKFDTLFGI